MFFFLSLASDKEKILSPHEELNLKPLDSVLRCSTTELQRLHSEQGPLQSSYMTLYLKFTPISGKMSNVGSGCAN